MSAPENPLESRRARRRRRRRERGERRSGLYLLPHLLTTANLFFGFYAIVQAFSGKPDLAAGGIVLAGVCDVLDGRVARLARATSRFGEEYDSIADVVSFGIAPAMLAFAAGNLHILGRPGWVMVFLFTACAALRLARFNVMPSRYPGRFEGLPSPAAAGMVASTQWFVSFLRAHGIDFTVPEYVVAGGVALLGLMMVSQVPYRSFKELDLRHSYGTLVVAVIAIAVIVQEPSVSLFAIGILYCLAGPIEWVWRKLAHRPLRQVVEDPPPSLPRGEAMSDLIRIFDTTLRDGEQSPGCSMNLEEKLALARQLAKLGVDIIEAGFPIASEGDLESVKAISRAVREPVICALARTSVADVEHAQEALADAAKPRIHTFIATSDIHLEHKLRMTREQVLVEVDRAVRQARRHVDDVEFSAEDATRSDWDFLVEVFRVALEAGASTLNVPDTVGYTTPTEYYDLIEFLKANVPGSDRAVFSLHCHDDLGLAVANSLAAIRAGARQVECTVNGIGERAGNTAMEEVVMALKTRRDVYNGLDTRVVTTEIYPTSRLLSSIIGVPVQPNKAIVGDNAFAHEAGIHQDGVLKNKMTYEIMTPQSIGRASNELVLGKHSGRHAFRERLSELGFQLADEAFEQAFQRFKHLADAKKTIFNEDIEAIVADSVMHTDDRYELGDLSILSGTFAKPTATVELVIDGEKHKASGLGIGPVDAVFKAIADLTETKSELERYQVNAITGGMDALGEVSVTVSEDGRRVIGHGAHEDIIVASGKAYVHALNKLAWHKSQREASEPRGI